MPDCENFNDGGRRHRRPSSEKLRIVEETFGSASISVVARRKGVALNLLYRWRRLMLEGGETPKKKSEGLKKMLKAKGRR